MGSISITWLKDYKLNLLEYSRFTDLARLEIT